MAEKKATKTPQKGTIGKPPTRRERITDFSTDSFVGKPIFVPKRGKK